MKFWKLLFCAAALATVISCSSTDATGNYTKNEVKIFDISSRAALRNAENSGGKDSLYFTALLARKPDDEIKAKFAEINLNVMTNVGKIITCNAVPAQIRALAKCDFVVKIEIGKSLQIKRTGKK